MEEDESTVERYHLTERELAMVALIAEGHTDREIAQILSMNLTTVKNQLSLYVYPKLGVRNRTEAARWWWELSR